MVLRMNKTFMIFTRTRQAMTFIQMGIGHMYDSINCQKEMFIASNLGIPTILLLLDGSSLQKK